MASKAFLNVGAAIMFIIGFCLVSYGVLNFVGSAPLASNTNWLTAGLGFGCIGIFLIGGSVGLLWTASAKPQLRNSGPATLRLDLPGEIKLSPVTCRSCGGVLKPENIKMVADAPTVQCPYCGTAYQLAEQPKW